MEFLPTGAGGRIAAAVSAAMFERSRVLDAVENSRSHRGLDHIVE